MSREIYLSQLEQCFACPPGTKLSQEFAAHTRYGKTLDHMVPRQAWKIYHWVLDPIFDKPFNKAMICWGHHEATDVYKKEEFEQSGLLGVVRFLAFDYLRPPLPTDRTLTDDEEDLKGIWTGHFSTLFKVLRDNMVHATRSGPTGKITKSRMVGFEEGIDILNFSLEVFKKGQLYVPQRSVESGSVPGHGIHSSHQAEWILYPT